MNFKEQSEQYLTQIRNRKRKPLHVATVDRYRRTLDLHILPTLGAAELSQVNNASLKGLIADLIGLSPVALSLVALVVKQVVASAVDDQGNELFPRTWNNDFIDLPVVDKTSQKSPVATPEAIQQAISEAFGQDKALIALLAGSGLRIGECLALTVGPDDGVNSLWDPKTGTITVRGTTVGTSIQSATKTLAGTRQVDLDPSLNSYLVSVLNPAPGLVFKSEDGGVIPRSTIYEHLDKTEIPGFHSLRRFRVTHLRKIGTPEGLLKFWIGHEGEGSTDRYDKIREDLNARKQYAAQAGLGFAL